MSAVFIFLAGLLLASSLAAVMFRRLVYTALSLAVAFASLAALYLHLGAEFAGFAQVMVYVGAVAILIVFALLLTRNAGSDPEHPGHGGSWITGAAIAVLVFGCLAFNIVTSSACARPMPNPPSITTRQIGESLMTRYVLPLEVLGLLLTAAALGAATLALEDKRKS
jgi:NADH:ubiquinone oxidoreductase subunit 6 (subunit J)